MTDKPSNPTAEAMKRALAAKKAGAGPVHAASRARPGPRKRRSKREARPCAKPAFRKASKRARDPRGSRAGRQYRPSLESLRRVVEFSANPSLNSSPFCLQTEPSRPRRDLQQQAFGDQLVRRAVVLVAMSAC
jgi:hypothetical protein